MACHSTQALICALDFGRAASSPSSIAARGRIGVAVGLLLAEPDLAVVTLQATNVSTEQME